MKLPEIKNIMEIKKHQQVWSINVFDKETGSGFRANEHLPEELHKPVIKKFKRIKSE